MTTVTVSGNAMDHNAVAVPASLQPELWFRPLATSLAHGALTNREVKAELQSSGAFTALLESHPNIRYVPFMRWLTDTSQANLDPQNRALEYCEWQVINPGQGGDISTLDPNVGVTGLLYGFGPPPERLENVVYIDITGPQIRIYGPPNTFVEE